MTGQISNPPVSSSINRLDSNRTKQFLSLDKGASVPAFQLGVPRNQVHDFNGQAEIVVAVKLRDLHPARLFNVSQALLLVRGHVAFDDKVLDAKVACCVCRQEPVAGSLGRDGDYVLSDSIFAEVVEL
jgi:hypothetical protein